MMETLREVLNPDFLLRNAVYTSLLVGFACPLVGVHLILRRLVFMGVALPQVSSCGIAFAFAMAALPMFHHLHDSAEERALALAGSALFTLAAIFVLAVLERRSRGPVEARIGVVYVLAGALGILLLVENPHGEHGMLELLRGEIIAVSATDLRIAGAVFAIVLTGLILFRREFLLVSFDREMALTLKKNVLFWDALLFALIGLAISVSVLNVGPLVTFGFLLLPALTAYLFANTMRQCMIAASCIGIGASFAGFCIAYRMDWPVGPTDVALLGVVFVCSFCAKKLFLWRAG